MFHCNNLYAAHIQISFFEFEIERFLKKFDQILQIQFHSKYVAYYIRYVLAMYNLLVIPEIVDYYFSLLSPFSCVLLPEIRLQKYLSSIGWRL